MGDFGLPWRCLLPLCGSPLSLVKKEKTPDGQEDIQGNRETRVALRSQGHCRKEAGYSPW